MADRNDAGQVGTRSQANVEYNVQGQSNTTTPIADEDGATVTRGKNPITGDVSQDIGSGGSGDFTKKGLTEGVDNIKGAIRSMDSNTFTVEFEWLNANDTTRFTETFTELSDITSESFNIIVKGPKCRVRVKDTSGQNQNRIRGTLESA